MSNILSDPLFLRAEMEYRRERYGGTSPHHEVWPDLLGRWRRRVAGHLTARRPQAPGVGLTARRPRHP